MQYDNIMILKRLISKKYPLYRTMMSNKYKSNGEYLEQKEFLVQDPEGYLLRFTHEQLINSENGGQLIKKFSICFRYGIDKFRLCAQLNINISCSQKNQRQKNELITLFPKGITVFFNVFLLMIANLPNSFVLMMRKKNIKKSFS